MVPDTSTLQPGRVLATEHVPTPLVATTTEEGNAPDIETKAATVGKERKFEELGEILDGDGDVLEQKKKKPKQKRKTPAQRHESLAADKWTETVEAHRVFCSGCRSWIALRNDREYDLKNWDKHRAACPRISGVVKQRYATKQSVQIRDTVRS